MNGQDLLNLLTSILGDETIDTTFGLQLINIARSVIETKRPWQVLKAKDGSQSISGSNTWNSNPLTIPASPTFRSFLKEGKIQVFNNGQLISTLYEVPFEESLAYKDDSTKFYVDYANGQIYLCGVQQSGTAYIWYRGNYGDITLNTQWLKFPAEYHPILAYEAAVMWRLGTDYDDVNARNADENARVSDLILGAMTTWDAELAIGSVNNLDYGESRIPTRIIAGRGSDGY